MKRTALTVGEVYAEKRSKYSSSYSRFWKVLDTSAGQETVRSIHASTGRPGVRAQSVKLDEESGEWVNRQHEEWLTETSDSILVDNEPTVVALSKLECTGDEALAKMVEEAEWRDRRNREAQERLDARVRVNGPLADALLELLPDHWELRPESAFRNGSSGSISLNAEQLAKLIGFDSEAQS